MFQEFGLKIIEIDDDYKLTPDELLKYADKFKVILEKKSIMKASIFTFFVTKLIDDVFLASM